MLGNYEIHKGENFVTYTNTLSIPPAAYYTSGPLAGLTFSRPIEWDFSCDYGLESVVKSDYVLESKMHKWAFNEGVGSFQFDLNFFENEYFDAELDNLAVSVGKPVYFNVEMNEGKCSKSEKDPDSGVRSSSKETTDSPVRVGVERL